MAIKNVDAIGAAAAQVFPGPIIASRAPGNADRYELGRVWIDKTGQDAYFLTAYSGGNPVWIGAGGAAGVFTSLAVTGNSTFTGNIVQTGGTWSLTSNGTGVLSSTGVMSLTSAAVGQTALLFESSSATGGQTFKLGEALGATSWDFVDSADGVALSVGSDGDITVVGDLIADTATTAGPAATAALTLEGTVGVGTFTGYTQIATGTLVITVTNTIVTVGSAIMVSAANLGANDAQMTVTRVVPGAGSYIVTLTNNGAAALNGDIILTAWVLVK